MIKTTIKKAIVPKINPLFFLLPTFFFVRAETLLKYLERYETAALVAHVHA